MIMNKENLLRWLAVSILLCVPVFACIDVAFADYRGGVTVAHAWQLYDKVHWGRFAEVPIDRVQTLAHRYWVMPAAIFAISFILATSPQPYPTKKSDLVEDQGWGLECLLILGAAGLIIFLPMFIILYGTPTLLSLLRNEWLQKGLGRAALDVTEISCTYSLTSLQATVHFMFENAGGSFILGLLAVFGPFLVVPPLASTAGMLIGGVIGAHRYEEARKCIKMEWEAYTASMYSNREALMEGSNVQRDGKTPKAPSMKPHGIPDGNIFASQLREHLKKPRRSARHEAVGEADENMQEFKRRVEEKDRTWYIA
jgi:hypothetical protein